MLIDWQTKMRAEMHFQERPIAGRRAPNINAVGSRNPIGIPVPGLADGWRSIREYWQYGFSIERLEEVFPYLDFDDANQFGADRDEGDDEYEIPRITLSSGVSIAGENCAGEYHRYVMAYKLNRLGRRMAAWYSLLASAGVDIGTEGYAMLSVAPWEGRNV